MTNILCGTVTFLFSAIVGSTLLWEKHPEAMKAALTKHDAILRDALESNHGLFWLVGSSARNCEVKTEVHAVFLHHNSPGAACSAKFFPGFKFQKISRVK